MVEVPTKFIINNTRQFDLELWINDITCDFEINDLFPYRVAVYDYDSSISNWITENLKDIWAGTQLNESMVTGVHRKYEFYFFRNENDAVLFKLRWG